MDLRKVGPLLLGASVLLAGCHLDMWVQPKVKAQSENTFYSDGRGTRNEVPGTVEFEKPKSDEAFYTGYENGKLVREFPVKITKEFLMRGQERFTIYCSHCHGALGDGEGMIAHRGFALRRPVGNYQTERLREMPVGHFFDVITNGYGTMYPQGARVQPLDRWAIVAYIRVLQQSRYTKPEDMDPKVAEALGVQPGSATGPLFKTPEGAPTRVVDPGTPENPNPAINNPVGNAPGEGMPMGQLPEPGMNPGGQM